MVEDIANGTMAAEPTRCVGRLETVGMATAREIRRREACVRALSAYVASARCQFLPCGRCRALPVRRPRRGCCSGRDLPHVDMRKVHALTEEWALPSCRRNRRPPSASGSTQAYRTYSTARLCAGEAQRDMGEGVWGTSL